MHCRIGVHQQQAPLLQVGQLPSIQDTSDSNLPTADTHPQQPGYLQQLWSAAQPADTPSAGQLAQNAAAGKQQAASGLCTWQQQHVNGKPPVSHMCLEDTSRDVLVFLSDCDATQDSLRPN